MAEYRHSAHATFDLKYHVIWITKYRYKILRGRVAERARDLIRQVGAGAFCATVGAVDEAMIKAYIENQKWDEDDQGFKITAPTEP
jgi:putative transposase